MANTDLLNKYLKNHCISVFLRLCRPDDIPFLQQIYLANRWNELTVSGWPDDMRRTFLIQQFQIQCMHYDHNYPQAMWFIIEMGHTPIGRLYLNHTTEDFRIIDISLLPDYRSQGIGSALIRTALHYAHSTMTAKVSLHVEQSNPAQRLYRTLGFIATKHLPPYYYMEYLCQGNIY